MNRNQTTNDTVQLQNWPLPTNNFFNFLQKSFLKFQGSSLCRFYLDPLLLELPWCTDAHLSYLHHYLGESWRTFWNLHILLSHLLLFLSLIYYEQLFSFSAVITISNCLTHLFICLTCIFLHKSKDFHVLKNWHRVTARWIFVEWISELQ